MGGLSKTSSGVFFFNRMALFGGEIVEATFCQKFKIAILKY